MSGIDNFLNKQQNNSNYFIMPSDTAAPAIPQTPSVPHAPSTQITPEVTTNPVSAPVSTEVRDEFVKLKKNNGFLRKFYNFLKNKTGIGTGTKAVEKEIDKFEKGEISKDELNNKISEYKVSQENFVQSAGDITTAAVTVSGYFAANNFIKKLRATNELDALPQWFKKLREHPPRFLKNKILTIENILKSKSKTTMVLLPILALVGGLTKLQFGQIERIGSKEFKKDKTLDKQARKADKKAKNKLKRKENWKNFYTGAINGMLAPVTALVGGIAGVPAYIAAQTGLRYVTSKNGDKEKSLKDFTQNIKDNAVVNTVTTAAIAVPAFKKAHFGKVLSENLDKVVKKLKGKQLQLPDLPSQKTAYQELEDIMIASPSIQNILKSDKTNMDAIINELTKENIFAVKFLQIKNSGGLIGGKNNPYMEISEALRENCPPTRTLEQAQEHINSLWGSAEYTVSKLLGVGTVAETYLAKDKSGKEVCIKVLKEGISADKIAKDKEKFIKLITGDTPADKLTENQKYLIKNIEDLAEGISKEVDFVNEMNAAKELKKHCKVTNVAVPIDAKQGIYVMEKAPGISVKTLVDYYNTESWLQYVKKRHAGEEWAQREIAHLEEQMKKIKSRAPEFEDFDMTPAQIKKLLKTYIDLHVEQFTRIDKNGKVIHADIHPGNIFINLEALKSGKGKLFTLIDTGNTITLSKEQAKQALRITKFIQNGNTKDLTQIVLEGAVLPQGLTKEQAIQKVETDLKKYFFDSDTKINTMNMDTFYALSDNILRKYGIIPNNTQLNLQKAKISASNSFEDLLESFFSKKYGDKDLDNASKVEKATAIANGLKDIAQIMTNMATSQKWQETKNLFQMSFKEAWNFLFNKNMLKTNGEDFLTYEIKQSMPGPKDKMLEELEKMRDALET